MKTTCTARQVKALSTLSAALCRELGRRPHSRDIDEAAEAFNALVQETNEALDSLLLELTSSGPSDLARRLAKLRPQGPLHGDARYVCRDIAHRLITGGY